MQIEDDSPKVRVPPPLVYLGILLLGVGLGRLFGDRPLGLPGDLRHGSAALLLVLGVAVIFASAALFRKAKTNIEPWRSSTTVISHGIYGRTRNPIYVGMTLIYLALALLSDSLVALAGLPAAVAIIRWQVIAREERYLEAKFGDSYRDYKARVRRWL